MHWFLILLLAHYSSAWAQHAEQPQKEETSDLRLQSEMFSIEMIEESQVYWLERTSDLDYYLRFKQKDDEKVIKLASREGAKLDREFASRFIKCQYEILEVPGDCKVSVRLRMKGEEQNLCKKDDKKSQEIGAFIGELKQRL